MMYFDPCVCRNLDNPKSPKNGFWFYMSLFSNAHLTITIGLISSIKLSYDYFLPVEESSKWNSLIFHTQQDFRDKPKMLESATPFVNLSTAH